jgi:hypothetical protein
MEAELLKGAMEEASSQTLNQRLENKIMKRTIELVESLSPLPPHLPGQSRDKIMIMDICRVRSNTSKLTIAKTRL